VGAGRVGGAGRAAAARAVAVPATAAACVAGRGGRRGRLGAVLRQFACIPTIAAARSWRMSHTAVWLRTSNEPRSGAC